MAVLQALLAVCRGIKMRIGRNMEQNKYHTIGVIESSVDCKVIGLVLFPEKDAFRSEGKELKIDDEEFAEFRNYVESAIGRNIKIYRLQCSWEIDDLYENVLDYFGDDCE